MLRELRVHQKNRRGGGGGGRKGHLQGGPFSILSPQDTVLIKEIGLVGVDGRIQILNIIRVV
jgi:hypothetical protein